ncbi:MAG: HD-GYP domain-containing protein [Phycisphaerae bacterium]|jgi:HD-GYP domain-containing protein (c-di-GMP phosphodiesterase class II)
MLFQRMFKSAACAGASVFVRPIALYVIAINLTACAMVMAGSKHTTMLLACMIALMAAAVVLQVRWLLHRVGSESQIARDSVAQGEQHFINVLRQIVRIVEARDRYTKGHSERVGRLAEQIARKLDLPAQRCELMNLAGQLHDIGLLAVPDQVLNKQSDFGVADFRTVQKHSEISYQLLQPMDSLADVLPAIRYHHERINGTGYPMGLAGDQIPLEARILSVADAYEAMTHDRPQRAGMAPLPAVEELRRCTPSGYDEKCVEALADIVNQSKLKEIMKSEPVPTVA